MHAGSGFCYDQMKTVGQLEISKRCLFEVQHGLRGIYHWKSVVGEGLFVGGVGRVPSPAAHACMPSAMHFIRGARRPGRDRGCPRRCICVAWRQHGLNTKACLRRTSFDPADCETHVHRRCLRYLLSSVRIVVPRVVRCSLALELALIRVGFVVLNRRLKNGWTRTTAPGVSFPSDGFHAHTLAHTS